MPTRFVRQENCISNKIIDRATERIAAINDKLIRSNGRKKSSVKIKPLTIIAYTVTFFVVIGVISSGYTKANGPKALANATTVDVNNSVNQTSVDDIVAAQVAAGVARMIDLPISNSVINLSISAEAMSGFKQSEGTSLSKPQIIASVDENRSVISHTVADGENIESLAAKYNITKETIKWANNLKADTISPGSVLKILPINGVLYTVKAGDTVDSIASKYKVDPTQLVLYNDLDVSGAIANTSIILPSGLLPENERPGYIAPVAVYIRPFTVGNGYAYGYCTWYAYERRVQMGIPISGNLGNANTWARFSAGSRLVDRSPSAGAVLVDETGWYGHVAVVESVDENGNLHISEMNNSAYGGWNIVSNRVVDPTEAAKYRYIH